MFSKATCEKWVKPKHTGVKSEMAVNLDLLLEPPLSA